jgi:NAD+ synthase
MDCGGQTDEEKMGIKYSQIAEYIETGKTDKKVMGKIEKMNKLTNHKREVIPIYYFKRKNYLA